MITDDICITRTANKIPRSRMVAYWILATITALAMAVYRNYLSSTLNSQHTERVFDASYYLVNYHHGMVRRGLGGEIVEFISRASGWNYLNTAENAHWVILSLNTAAMIALFASIVSTRPLTDRRILLALVMMVLPNWFFIWAVASGPDTLGFDALTLFTLVLMKLPSPRRALVVSALFGAALATIALLHDGVVSEYGTGAVLAIIVFLGAEKARTRVMCAALAICPGALSAILPAVFAKKDILGEICSDIPERKIFIPILNRAVEYREVAYGITLNNLSKGVGAETKLVLQNLGPLMFLDTILGLLMFCLVILCIRYTSGVPFMAFFKQCIRNERANIILFVGAISLWVPLFVVAWDWVRWWSILSICVGLVYALWSRNRPESNLPLHGGVVKRLLVILAVFFALSLIGPGATRMSFDPAPTFLRIIEHAPTGCRS